MNPFTSNQLDRRWIGTAVVGLLLFLLIQVFPLTGQLFATNVHPMITRTEAQSIGMELAASRFGVQAAAVKTATVTHLSDSDTVGYYSKYKLLDTYEEKWSSTVPTDVYMVDLRLTGNSGHLLLSLHMESGKLVAWQHVGDSEAVSENLAEADEGKLVTNALSYAEFWGINTEQWEFKEIVDEGHGLRFNAKNAEIGESNLFMTISIPGEYNPLSSSFPPWMGGSITYGVDLPESFLTYMKDQERLSANLSKFGFMIPQIIMFILAIIYSGTHGGFTSYQRGIFLSSLYFILYVGITFNMIPGLRAGTWEEGSSIGGGYNIALMVISIVLYAGMALLTYFSAVAGDGLWKSMGQSLWPRWKESSYGVAVLQSMRVGYFLAFILLGAQSVVLLLLEKSLGSFAASDATQSMYNMTIPWILPLLAWCAGISEELQSRLFGIGIFRSWLVGGTRKLLRREPSRKTTIVLTTVAMIPPGLLWALGHVGYAIFPVYTRLIELVIMSILFGWFMLRFGIMTVIFAHVTLDAILMGMQMMSDGLPGDYFGGLFSFIMPGLVGIVIWWLHGVFRGGKSKPITT